MSLTQTEREFYSYCDSNDFVSADKIEEFRHKLEREGNVNTFSLALEKFTEGSCPNCSATGAFKWHFLGNLRHPNCGYAWYVEPGSYIGAQLRGVVHTGMSAGAGMSDQEKESKAAGCMAGLLGFMFGAIFRLVFAVVMIPIQAIFSLTQKKPESKSAAKQ